MPISERVNKDGSTTYVVCEDVGTTYDGRRDRRKVSCRTMAQARVEQAKMVAERDARRNRSGRMRLGDYIERVYWPSAAGLAPTSRDTYRREIDKRILPALGAMDVRDVDRTAIQRMVDGCATQDVARKAVSVLKTILNEVKGDGLIDRNPACARFSMPPKGRRRDNGLVVTTFAAMAPIMDAVDALGDGFVEGVAVLGLYLGLRPEERYGLDVGDIDVGARTVRVSQAYVSVSPRHGGNTLKETKTELSTRVLPIPRPAVGRLARLVEGRDDGPFLLGADGARVSPSTAQKRWAAFLRRCDAAGMDVPHVTIENMRHSFATSYLHAGGNVEDLSRFLGHSDINTTYRRYVRPSVDDLMAGIDGVL